MHAATTTVSAAERERKPASSFAAVAQEELDAVYAYLAYVVRDRVLAEELAAETFERALRAWSRFDPDRGSARTWLCQIARSVALDHFRSEERRRRREQAYAELEPRAAAEPALQGLSPEVDAALTNLSAADRELVVLRVVLDLDGPTTARLLGITPTACSTRLSRALHRMEERISDARS